jgi:phenylacetate-CoA ligase
MMGKMNLDKKIRETVANGYANAPAFQARFDKAGLQPADIQGVADLAKVPIQDKDSIVALQQMNPPFGGMLAVPESEISHIFFSPGPIYEPAPERDESAWDVAVESLRRCGFQAGEIVLNSFSYHLVPAGFLFDNSLVRLGCRVVPGGVGNSDLQLKMIQDLQITGYVGTPSFLLMLLEKADEQGVKLTLTHALVSAEPLFPPMRQAIEAYGITIGNAYATAEFGVVALDLGDGPAMQLMSAPLVQVVDPETGQTVEAGTPGEVVISNFSKVYPLVRFGTGDMAINVDPNPGKSTQEERAIILVGRSGEAAKVRGMFVHPNQLRFATGQIPGVKKVQGVVSQPELKDYFVVRVEAEGVDETAVAEQVKTAVQALCRIRVDEVEFIPPGSLADDAPGMVDARDWT